MTRALAVLAALAAAVLAAAALVRRRRTVPTYPDWSAYMADAEGDALLPDPYLSSFTAADEAEVEVDCE